MTQNFPAMALWKVLAVSIKQAIIDSMMFRH
jgi:hypothetical protein